MVAWLPQRVKSTFFEIFLCSSGPIFFGWNFFSQKILILSHETSLNTFFGFSPLHSACWYLKVCTIIPLADTQFYVMLWLKNFFLHWNFDIEKSWFLVFLLEWNERKIRIAFAISMFNVFFFYIDVIKNKIFNLYFTKYCRKNSHIWKKNCILGGKNWVLFNWICLVNVNL